MLIRIDPGDPRPLYEQIELQVRAAIGDGSLVPGERLPSDLTVWAAPLARSLGALLFVLAAFATRRELLPI